MSALPVDDPRVAVALRTAAGTILDEIRTARGGKVPKRYRRYINDPVGFFRNELGIEPWSRQADLIATVALFDRVLCRSGHKCGKSVACVGLALWWVATRARGYVVLTAPTFHQVKDILWAELDRWYPKVQAALGGEPLAKDPATGLSLPGGRKIIGLSTKKPENLAGRSGSQLLFIVDEASGYPDELLSVLRGNSAGGAKIVGISNPTRTVGWFYDGFRSGTYDLRPSNDNGVPPSRWRLLHISSEESPNVVANDNGVLVEGLALRSYIDEMRDECGPDYETSAEYLVRVRGEFPAEATDCVIGLKLLKDAIARWSASGRGDGALTIGVDVARFGGDETVIQAVRGKYAWPAVTLSKKDGPEIADEVARLALMLRREGERVRVNVDGIGVGASVVDALRRHDVVRAKKAVVVVDVNVGEAADDGNHFNLRSQLWFGIAAWLRDGGALPENDDLEGELMTPTYTFDVHGRKQVMGKKEIRRILKRSPDRADALALAVYRGRADAYGYKPATQTKAPQERDRRADDRKRPARGGTFGRRGGAL